MDATHGKTVLAVVAKCDGGLTKSFGRSLQCPGARAAKTGSPIGASVCL
jgi:hypothetical protein